MDYCTAESRNLARFRCLDESLRGILEKRQLPKSLCYAHSFEFFECCPKQLESNTRILADGGIGVYLDFHPCPKPNSPLAFGSYYKKKIYDSRTLLLCSRRLRQPTEILGLSSSAIWLEIIGVSEVKRIILGLVWEWPMVKYLGNGFDFWNSN